MIPNERYDDAHKIWDLALEGMPLRRITFTLFELGIVSPTGKPGWSISVVHNMLTHPAYYDEYYALRMEVREPKNRIRRHSYGKSSWRFSDPNLG